MCFDELRQQQSLYASVPRASLIGDISDWTISVSSWISEAVTLLPSRNALLFARYIGTGPTPPADNDAAAIVCSSCILKQIAEFTLAISRLVRLQTFSKLKRSVADGNSNMIFSMISPVAYPVIYILCKNLSEIFHALFLHLPGWFLHPTPGRKW